MGRDLVRRITGMRILVIGSGAREHALLHSMSKDPQVGESDLHVAPGNAGMSELATICPAIRIWVQWQCTGATVGRSAKDGRSSCNKVYQ